jgi:hypothetical protein
MRLLERKAPGGPPAGTSRMMYKGPFEQVVAEDGTAFHRGEVVSLNVERAARLLQGPAAEQLAFLPK